MATEKKTTKKTSEKKTTAKKVVKPEETVEFVLHKTYTVEALESARVLIPGKKYEVTGEIARELHKKGYVKLVK